MNTNNKKIKQDMLSLANKIADLQNNADRSGRALTEAEDSLRIDMLAEINNLQMSLTDGPVTMGTGTRNLATGETLTLGQDMNNTAPTTTAPKGRDFRSMFGFNKGQTLDKGGFKDFNDFLNVLHGGRHDDRLKLDIQNAMGETVPSSGGFSVPIEYAAWLLDASLESEIVRSRATVWPMKSNSIKVPGWDAGTHTSTLFGGLVGTWLAESGTATEVYAKLRQIELSAKKLACYTSASNELIADGISFEQQLTGALIKTIGWYLDYAFLCGTGAGQPLGILNDPALVTVAAETGQHTGILYENVVKLYARLAPQCMGNSVWIASQTAVPSLLSLVISVGTGGSTVNAVTQSATGQFTLLGRPLLFTEKVPALNSKGDLILCDPSQYAIGLRSEVTLDKSNAPGWTRDESSYRAIVRADGMGMWDKAITPKNGDSLSWCVTLAARS